MLIKGMPFSEYEALPGLRASALKNMARSPLHYRHGLRNARRTSALELGVAAHLPVLRVGFGDTNATWFHLDPVSGEPIDLDVTVKKIAHNVFQPYGPVMSPLGDMTLLSSEHVDIAICTLRNQTFHADAFRAVGAEPERHQSPAAVRRDSLHNGLPLVDGRAADVAISRAHLRGSVASRDAHAHTRRRRGRVLARHQTQRARGARRVGGGAGRRVGGGGNRFREDEVDGNGRRSTRGRESSSIGAADAVGVGAGSRSGDSARDEDAALHR